MAGDGIFLSGVRVNVLATFVFLSAFARKLKIVYHSSNPISNELDIEIDEQSQPLVS
jgi:hypothetical protein